MDFVLANVSHDASASVSAVFVPQIFIWYPVVVSSETEIFAVTVALVAYCAPSFRISDRPAGASVSSVRLKKLAIWIYPLSSLVSSMYKNPPGLS